ncbi:unnamed protein product [Anisakis simplex]|uniref:Transposon Tf2-1 polyprotein n=1 Tax=Anisakis simplex TaxID=6269 RepID=A0A0M3KA91_ANISI|nr:unnamed protein product [Anisakis simplex]
MHDCILTETLPTFVRNATVTLRDVELDDEFKEIHERIVKIISKLAVEKNKLSGETSDAVVKQKNLSDERHSLEEQLSAANQESVVVGQQIAEANNRIAKTRKSRHMSSTKISQYKGVSGCAKCSKRIEFNKETKTEMALHLVLQKQVEPSAQASY